MAHIHTLNDEEVIDRSVRALLDQTHPLQEILLVDNGSTDGTLRRVFPDRVTIIRHPKNQGTSGAVLTGFQYALVQDYDWIWLFDADSAPRKDALEKLIALYEDFSPALKEQTWLLACLPIDENTHDPYHGIRFTPRGPKPIPREPERLFYECDATMWTGSLYKLAAVRNVGLPPADYVLDWGEYEYGYRGRRNGYRAFIHERSILDHNIGGEPSLRITTYQLGPISFRMLELPPIRLYYFCRNMIYFWLYEYRPRSLVTIPVNIVKALLLTAHFLRWPINHTREIRACVRGLWDGLRRNMHQRY